VRRDWDLIREILLRVEAGDGEKEIECAEFAPASEALVAHNMWLLIETGMAEGGGRRPGSMGPPHAYVYRLSWSGHELLDQIRQESVWVRIKSIAKEKGVDLSVDAIKGLAKLALEQILRG